MKENVIYTALPDGIHFQDGKVDLRLSVFVSPRLEGDAPMTSLASFPTFFKWPDFANEIQWRLRFKRFSNQETTDIAKPVRNSKDADPQLWQALFGKSMVESYKFPDLSAYQVQSFPAIKLWEKLEGLYRQFSTRQDAPEASELAKNPAILSLAEAGGIEEFLEPGQLQKLMLDWQTGPDAEFLAGLQELRDFYPGKPPLVKKPEIPRLDFHKAVAALGEYSLLLRSLGLAVDLLVEFNEKILYGSGGTAVQVLTDQAGAECPWTMYELIPPPKPRFVCAPGSGDVQGRRLFLGAGSAFEWSEVDVDGSALKGLDFGLNVLRMAIKHTEGAPEQSAMPALRSGGLSLLRLAQGDKILKSLSSQKSKNAALGSSPSQVVLTASDVNRGYRLDIWDEKAQRWLSLCQRTGLYKVVETGQMLSTFDLGEVDFEECAVAPAARKQDEAGAQTLFIHESLFHWDGWSLGATRPEKTLGEGAIPRSGEEINLETSAALAGETMRLPLEATFKPLKGSLPRLRFGHAYRLRARLVDLAGNSEPWDGKGKPDSATDSASLTYKRLEPLPPPLLIPLADFSEPVPPFNEPRSPGESLELLVMRSFNNEPAKDTQPANAHTERRVAPAPCSQSFAELHGAFDAPQNGGEWQLDPKAYQLIASHEKPPNDIEPLLPEEDQQPPKLFELTYLPDPLAQSVLFIGLPGTITEAPLSVDLGKGAEWIDIQAGPGMHYGVIRVDFLHDAKWPKALPMRLVVIEGDGLPHWDSERRVLGVGLPKAHTAQVGLCSGLGTAAQLGWMKVWEWIQQQAPIDLPQMDPKEVEKRAMAGRFLMLTPPRSLRLAHAVQQPIGLPTFTEDSNKVFQVLNKAAAGKTDIRLRGGLKVHGLSTARVEVTAHWKDWVESYDGGKLKSVAMQSFEAPVVDKLVAETEELWDFNFRHDLGDTRHRWVDYLATASSRFKEYFSSALPTTRQSQLLANYNKQVNVLNSARPPALKVAYLIPLFTWQRSLAPGGEIQSRRLGGLRVYLEPPWHLSGDDEKLGVVTWDGQAGQPADVAGIPDELKPHVSSWGNDPIWLSPLLRLDKLSFNRPAPLDAVESLRAADMTQRGKQLTLPEAPAYRVSVDWFKVEFDPGQGLYFSDIGIDTLGSYMPFVRLALARFQPYSLDGLHLSPVELADFIQVTPQRFLSVSWNPQHPEVIGLALSGPRYSLPPEIISPRPTVEVHLEQFGGPVEEMDNLLRWVPFKMCTITRLNKTASDPADLIYRGKITFSDPSLAPSAVHPRKLVVEEYEFHWNEERSKVQKRLVYAEGVILGIS